MCRRNPMFFPIILILVGVYFLLRNYGALPAGLEIEKLWPLILIIAGVAALSNRGPRGGDGDK